MSSVRSVPSRYDKEKWWAVKKKEKRPLRLGAPLTAENDICFLVNNENHPYSALLELFYQITLQDMEMLAKRAVKKFIRGV